MMYDERPHEHPTQFTGHDIVDERGYKIGTVSDVIYSASDDVAHPRWLVVNTGLLGGSHYAPADLAFVSSSGVVVAEFDRQTVKTSPRAKRDHVVEPGLENELRQHYSLAS